MQVRKRKGSQEEEEDEEEEINLHGSASTQSLKAGGAPGRSLLVMWLRTGLRLPKEQNKGNIFSADGNRPY